MIDSGDCRRWLGRWNRHRGSRRIPARADFDPLELKMILPRLMLLEVVDDPPDFRYRLAGTASRELTGLDWTGHSVQRSEEHTSELQSLMRISYAVFCLTNKNTEKTTYDRNKSNTETNHISTTTIKNKAI